LSRVLITPKLCGVEDRNRHAQNTGRHSPVEFNTAESLGARTLSFAATSLQAKVTEREVELVSYEIASGLLGRLFLKGKSCRASADALARRALRPHAASDSLLVTHRPDSERDS
jgi:hypothetical protein